MTFTYSPVLGLYDITTGSEVGQWGIQTNENVCALIEQAIAGQQNIPLANNATSVTLTTTQGAVNQARSMGLAFTGALTVDKPIVIPNLPKMYVIFNKTTGGANSNIVITPSGGTTTAKVLQGQSDIIWCDGSGAAYSMFKQSLNTYLPITGGTLIPPTPTTVTLTIKGLSGQTANLMDWRDAASNLLMSVSSGGNLTLNGAAQVGTNLRVLGNTYFGNGNYRAYTDANFDYLSYAPTFYWSYARATGDLYWTQSAGEYFHFQPGGNFQITGNVVASDVTFGGSSAFFAPAWSVNTVVATPQVGGPTIIGYYTTLPGSYSAAAWQVQGAIFELRSSGIAYAPLGWQVSSDRRIKDDIEPIHDALFRLQQIVGATFSRNDGLRRTDKTRHAGLIAQDVFAVLPEATSLLDWAPASDPNGDPIMAVDAMGVLALVVEAVKELSTRLSQTRYEMGLDGGR